MLQLRRSGPGSAGARSAPRAASAHCRLASRRASEDAAALPPTSDGGGGAGGSGTTALPPPRPTSGAGGAGSTTLTRAPSATATTTKPAPIADDECGDSGGPLHLLEDLAKAVVSSAAAALVSASPVSAAATPPPPAPPPPLVPSAFQALGREMMLEGALHVSGPQLGACLQRYGSGLQKAVAQPAPTLASSTPQQHQRPRNTAAASPASPRQRALAQEEAVCLATPTEPANVREQRLPSVPRLPTVNAAANEAAAAASSGRSSLVSEQFFLWRSATAADGEGARGAAGGGPAASRPLAAALRRLGRRAGLSPNGARLLMGDALGAGASIDAAENEEELIACRRTAASIAARVGAAHATRRERRRLALRARRAARDLLAGLSVGGGGGSGGDGGTTA
jgi:hypothetical protein